MSVVSKKVKVVSFCEQEANNVVKTIIKVILVFMLNDDLER